MAASFQKARRYREKQEQGAVLPPLPEKPENVRFGIVFLYAACTVALVFLIITGDVQWQEAGASGQSHLRIVIVQMAVTALLEGACAYLLSRCHRWPLYLVYVLTAVNAGFLAVYCAELFAFSQGLVISRLLSLLMDMAAVVFFQFRSSREWFALLRDRASTAREQTSEGTEE